MNNESFTADLITVIEKGFFLKTEHLFGTQSDTLGVLTLNAGKTEGTFTGQEDLSLIFEKIGFWKSHYELKQEGMVIASAVPRGGFSRVLIITCEGELFALLPGKGLSRSWILKNSQDQFLCEFKPRGTFKRGAMLRIINQIPISLLVFSYCLVSKKWQEQPAAAAA
jgi:hypothetical protein